MTTIAIAGAGVLGTATLEQLLDAMPGSRFTVLDRSPEALSRISAVAPERIETLVCDLQAETIDLPGVAAVVNTAGPFYVRATGAARLALSTGAIYVDICDDCEGTEAILDLHDEAIAANVPLITGSGSSPGLSNLMAKRLVELHPHADGVRVVWASRAEDPAGYAMFKHMLHMATVRSTVYRDGAFTTSAGWRPSTAVTYELPAPFDTCVGWDSTHPEPLTFPRAVPGIKNVVCQGILQPGWGMDMFRVFASVGFGDDTLDLPEGIEPARVLFELLWARHRARYGTQVRGSGLMAIQAQALSGETVLGTMTMSDPAETIRTTAIGAAATTIEALENRPAAGAWGTEILDAQRTLDLAARMAEKVGAVPDGFVTRDLTGG